MDVKKRVFNCEKQNLCFVSLKPLIKDNHTFLDHSVAGIVAVNNEYINPKPKVEE